MKKITGFTDNSYEPAPAAEVKAADSSVTPVKKTLVSVHFDGIAKDYSYLNDRFDLKVGDMVFVAGKLFGKPGYVSGVTTCFKIDASKFKKILSKPDTSVKGEFIEFNDKMVSFNTTVTPERFAEMIISPPDPDAEEEHGEIITGDGWCVDLDDFESDDYVEQSKLQPALEYCVEGKVIYLSVNNGKGTAFISGSTIYRVDFEFDGTTVSGIYCDCPFPAPCLCKHELAMLITLRMLTGADELEGKNSFTAIDKNFFFDILTSKSRKIVLG